VPNRSVNVPSMSPTASWATSHRPSPSNHALTGAGTAWLAPEIARRSAVVPAAMETVRADSHTAHTLLGSPQSVRSALVGRTYRFCAGYDAQHANHAPPTIREPHCRVELAHLPLLVGPALRAIDIWTTLPLRLGPQGTPAGTGYLFPIVRDVEAVYRDVRARGIAVRRDLRTEDREARAFQLGDPSGNLILVAEEIGMRVCRVAGAPAYPH